MTDLRELCTRALPDAVALLKQLVDLESPSRAKAAVDVCSALVAQRLQALGAEVTRVTQTTAGDHLAARWSGGAAGPASFLTLCHLDTVWPVGTLEHMPIHQEGDRLFGPGAYDMKGGTVILLTALRVLQEAGLAPRHPLRMLFTSDEEVGSVTSRALIEAEARDSRLVLVLEPAMAGGRLKTFRKGVGGFQIVAYGQAAHAGADHRKGISAIVELAHQIIRLQEMTDYTQGTTINVGTVQGGTASNVVPERAEMEVDFRVSKKSEADRIMSIMESLSPVLNGTRLEIMGGLNRPPMERNATMLASFEQAKRIGASMGINLEEGATGGGSDGNFTAALGIPTLDGLGPLGDGAHAGHEHVLISGLAERAALLAAILTQWET